jgi:hypothetical protein
VNKKILLWYDVEDYLTLETDETLFRLLQMLDESGVKCTLKFCTKKYRLLKERGRTDILKLVANHELAFHTTNHSVHPLPTEYLDRMGFREGAEEFDNREYSGFEELKATSGQNLTSYGHPGVAWAPQVFPALRRWGVPTYLDVHDIVGVGGQPFWYGGVLCFTKLNNLAHLVKNGSKDEMIDAFNAMNLACTDTVFLSIYDHPHELSTKEFWDEVNFAHGRNPFTYQPAPLRGSGEEAELIDQYRTFIRYTSQQPDVEYVTALESMRYEKQRVTPITDSQVKGALSGLGGQADYALVGDAYCTPSEILNLTARLLTNRMLTPELLYGPERSEKSVITGPVKAVELAEAVFSHTERVMGYKQLPSLYRLGDTFINPTDAFATLSKAVLDKREEIEVVSGCLAAANHVNEFTQFGGGWLLWDPEFQAKGIVEQTKLQTWTLKPAIF